jgi:hypothetical protein
VGALIQQGGAASSPWTSNTLAGEAGWSRRWAFSACTLASSRCSGSVGGRPRRLACPSAPLSCCLRHSEISEVYSPSRRSNAPLPALSSRLVLAQDPQLVGSRILPRWPGPLGHLQVGHPVHGLSLHPDLGGGHRRHRLVVVPSRPPLTYSSRASVSREIDTEAELRVRQGRLCPNDRWTALRLLYAFSSRHDSTRGHTPAKATITCFSPVVRLNSH